MDRLFLGLGCNLGDRLNNITGALKAIELNVGAILKKSSVYETKAWGKEEQPDFLNIAVEVNTALSAEDVLLAIQKIETDFGRVRKERWGSRTMDIDVLFYVGKILISETLTVPHPLIEKRRFVLLPVAEIAPDFVHPVLQKTMAQLLIACEDRLEVTRLDNIYN